MRLRILPLLTERSGEASRTPFVLVFDRTEQHEAEMIALADESLKKATGAVGVLALSCEVELS